MNAFKYSFLSFPVLLLAALGFFIFHSFPQVIIESLESKTIDGKEVFNQISYSEQKEQDVWSMRQSHFGAKYPKEQWDELRITVDKRTRPYQASFQQFKNGVEVEYRVSCFLCHSNGPRAIRPNWQSSNVEYTFKEKLAVAQWNLKIKSYGTITIKKETKKRNIPLAFEGKMDREILQVKTCLLCHGDKITESKFKRAPLLRQHVLAIDFLVSTGQMPPFPFTLSAQEKLQLQQFIQGF